MLLDDPCSDLCIPSPQIGGIIGGCFVPVLMCILWLSGVFTKYGCASPFAKTKEPGVNPTGVEAVGGV